ncbi:MAG: DUF371 domain-containing protein [Methanobrevibacter sp.]|jgi:hypothetical protein|nr:DUF371 domain-containing protein [Candidatus Methanovirga basalitermitum]
MIVIIKAMGHENISSKHKTTFEITKDENLTPEGDCIVGVSSDKSMKDLSKDFKEKIANDNSLIKVELSTKNGHDEITGYGHHKLTLTHPTDIVCRKSSYVCPRTLMIKSNKASIDLNRQLIEDLKNGEGLTFKISLE